MQFTYNITFVVAPESERELIDYIKSELMPVIFNPDTDALNPELKKIIEAGGEKPGPEYGISIALAASFNSEERAHLWNDHVLLPSLESFHEKFGERALFFITLLQNLRI